MSEHEIQDLIEREAKSIYEDYLRYTLSNPLDLDSLVRWEFSHEDSKDFFLFLAKSVLQRRTKYLDSTVYKQIIDTVHKVCNDRLSQSIMKIHPEDKSIKESKDNE
jgi:hypothetical protein